MSMTQNNTLTGDEIHVHGILMRWRDSLGYWVFARREFGYVLYDRYGREHSDPSYSVEQAIHHFMVLFEEEK